MTDNEIIKAWECCGETPKCKECPYGNKCKDLPKNTIDLIKRKDAEIERIKKDLKYYLDTNEENGVVWIPKFTVDNLVKEMVGDKK